MNKVLLIITIALAACTDVNSVTGDIIPFGQVYDCDLEITILAPTNIQIHYPSHPCLADENAEGAYEDAWVANTCFPYLKKHRLDEPGKGGCYGGCHLADYGLDVCSPN